MSVLRRVSVVVLCLTTFPLTGAFADEPSPAPTVAEIGMSLRCALGLDVQTCALLGLSAEQYEAIITATNGYCETNRATIEPLMEAMTAAKKAVDRAYELGDEDIVIREEALVTAINALAQSVSTCLSNVGSTLGTERTAKFTRIASNRLLDPGVAMLELTTEQRTSLMAAQRDRDRVLRHHQKRKDPKAVHAALSAYDTAVESILSQSQRAERTQMKSEAAQRVSEILRTDADSAAE